jgi:hypothetical protein
VNKNGADEARARVRRVALTGGQSLANEARARLGDLDRALEMGNAFRALRAAAEVQYAMGRIALHVLTAVETEERG